MTEAPTIGTPEHHVGKREFAAVAVGAAAVQVKLGLAAADRHRATGSPGRRRHG